MSTALLSQLIGAGVPWLVNLIIEATKGDPAPTKEEVLERLDKAIREHTLDADWLDNLLKQADKDYQAP